MNEFFYQSRGKEKIKELMKEGMRGQALQRAGGSKRFVFNLSKLALMLLGVLAILNLLGH
jgi:hypothetical protein